jgi:hypothetical protein
MPLTIPWFLFALAFIATALHPIYRQKLPLWLPVLLICIGLLFPVK